MDSQMEEKASVEQLDKATMETEELGIKELTIAKRRRTDKRASVETDGKEIKGGSFRQVVAIVAVIVLVLMYVVTFIVACLDFPEWDRLFQACIVASVGIPILLWIYITIYKRVKK